ncbi:hypothetical protein D9M68_956400 [compost metagenome]
MNGRKVSFTPFCAWKEFFALRRSLAILVMSTSWTCVSWVEMSRDSRMRRAMTWRMRGAFCTVPRSDEAAAETGAAVAEDAGAAAAGAGAALASAAAITSCLRMRPPTPVPVREEMSTPCWLASLRTRGVT